MDVCRGDVLPYAPAVMDGMKSLKAGLAIAFGLASLSHVLCSRIRMDSMRGCETISRYKRFAYFDVIVSLASQVIPIGIILFRDSPTFRTLDR